ncbi:MAG: hypothetical protein ACON4U_11555 [Myxococcota bacterium]
MSLVSLSLFLLHHARASIPIVGPDGPVVAGVSSHPEYLFYPSASDHDYGYESIWVDWETGHLQLSAEDSSGVIRRYSNGVWTLPEVPEGFDYQQQGPLLLSVVDTRGGRWNYRYNTDGKLREVSWPNGGIVRIRYGSDGRVTQILGPSSERLDVSWGERIILEYSTGQSYRIDLDTDTLDTGYRVQDIFGRQVVVKRNAGEWQIQDPRGLTTLIEETETGLSIQDVNGSIWRLNQDNKQLTEVFGPWGRQKWLRDEDKLVVTGPGGQSQVNRFDDMNRIVEQQFGLYRQHYNYNTAGLLREVRNGLGHAIYLGYNQDGFLRRLEDASGGVLSLSRNTSGQVVEIIGRSNQVWRIERDVMGRVKRLVTPEGLIFVLQRNVRGEITVIEEAFLGQWVIDRDAMGKPSRVTFPQGAIYLFNHNNQGSIRRVVLPDQSQIHFNYDRMGWLNSVDYGSEPVRILRDALGRVQRWGDHRLSYDIMGNISEIDAWLKFERSSNGNIQKVSSGDYQLSVEYDLQGFPVRWTDTYEEWSTIRDPNGRIIELNTPALMEVNRDPRGWINSIHFGELDWRFLRNASGNLLKVVLPNGQSYGFEQDDFQRLNWIRYPDGLLQRYDWTGSQLQLQVLGSDGGLLSERLIDYDDRGRIEMTANTNGAEIRAEYDNDGILKSLSSSDSMIYQHSELQSLSRDGTLITYDGYGQTNSILMTPPFLPYGSNQSTWMIERNEQSDIRVLDAQSEAWFVERDELGRLSNMCSAIGCWSFRYSPLGLMSAYSEPGGFWTPMLWAPFSSDLTPSKTPLLMKGANPILAHEGRLLAEIKEDVSHGLIYDEWGKLQWHQEGLEVQPVQHGIQKLSHGYSGIMGNVCGFQPVSNGPEFCGPFSKEVMSGEYLSANRLNWLQDWHPAFERPLNPSLEFAHTLGLIQKTVNVDWKSLPIRPSIPWLSVQLEQRSLWKEMDINQLAINQAPVEWWLTSLLISGQPDPTSAEVLAYFLGSENSLEDLNEWPYKDEFWWFRSDKFYPGLANISNTDNWHSSLWWE